MYFSKSYYGYFLIIAVLIVTVRALWPDQDDVQKREGRSWRLPNTSLPIHYDLHITTWIHREVLNFTGHVTIDVMVMENTSELVLHAKDLEIQRISIKILKTGRYIENLKTRIIDDLLVISVEKKSDADIFHRRQNLLLGIHYSGVIKDKEFGFQTITYGLTDTKIYGAYTHMQPTFARTVLPCYDEPGMKAYFTVSITHGKNVTAYSNMPSIRREVNCMYEMGTTFFKRTPIMCTYLLAFVVSYFTVISKVNNGLEHRVLRPRSSINCGELQLNNSVKAIETFERYVDYQYPLHKIDHVDVDLYPVEGMENWGLITYASSAFSEEEVLKNILLQNHEIIHNWFGNLVSPMWWDSIWLNEGLTTYYSYKLTDMLYPKLRAPIHFLENICYQKILEPVIEDVEKPFDIIRKFGKSIYKKAPCLLYLLSIIIGEETFHSGVKDYIRSYAYSNANSDQFFERIQNAIDNSHETVWKINVSEMMKPYFTRPSRPHITVLRNFSDSNLIFIKQHADWQSDETTELWHIPLSFAALFEEYPHNIEYILTIRETTLDLRNYNLTVSKDKPVLVSIPGIEQHSIYHEF